MTRLSEIDAHIASMGELFNVIGAMRSLAGMHMQEAERTLPGMRRYAAAVASGIADALLLAGETVRPPTADPGARRILLLCMAEHGFVGGFNERILEAAAPAMQAGTVLFVLGTRGAALLTERGHRPAFAYPMATNCATAPETVRRLSTTLYRHIAGGATLRVEMIHARGEKDGDNVIARRLLLPLDLAALRPGPAHQLPLHNLPPTVLLERLMAEYVVGLLTEAVVQSVAAENAARLAAMEAAHDNVAKKLDLLRRDARNARQSEITAEILELVSATMAFKAD